MTKGIVLSAVATAMLSGAVYIVPADIDGYKAKSDQTFYDMYQNDESVIANGVSGQMQTITSNVDTSSKMATGDTINRVGQTNIAGTPVKGGTSGSFTLAGKTYKVDIDKDGTPSLTGYLADGNGHILYKGKDAVDARSNNCASSGKYGCTVRTRVASEIYFDLPTGTLSTNTVSQKRNYSCGKYGCNPANNWYTTNTTHVDKKQLGLAELLSNNDISQRNIKTTPVTYSNDTDGKYS
jgi:hypothetical protein